MTLLPKACILRPYEEADISRIAALANNPRIARQVRDRFPHPYTEQDAREWVHALQGQNPLLNFAIVGPDGLMGGIGLMPGEDIFRLSAEVGYWLGEPYWGRGYASAAVRELCTYAFEQLGFVRLYAGVFSSNPASMRVLEKAGFTREAVLRRAVVKNNLLIDQVQYALTRAPGPQEAFRDAD